MKHFNKRSYILPSAYHEIISFDIPWQIYHIFQKIYPMTIQTTSALWTTSPGRSRTKNAAPPTKSSTTRWRTSRKTTLTSSSKPKATKRPSRYPERWKHPPTRTPRTTRTWEGKPNDNQSSRMERCWTRRVNWAQEFEASVQTGVQKFGNFFEKFALWYVT